MYVCVCVCVCVCVVCEGVEVQTESLASSNLPGAPISLRAKARLFHGISELVTVSNFL